MDIVLAILINKRRVHFRYIEIAVRDSRMAIHTTLSWIVVMSVMARLATESFMNTARGFIVTCSCLMKSVGCMTLDANPLKRII
jgi:hypothetical protein